MAVSVDVLSETAGNPSMLSSPQSRNRRNYPIRAHRTLSESHITVEVVRMSTSIAFNGRFEACHVRSTLAAAPTGLPGLPRPGSPAPALRGIALVRSVSRPFA